MKIRTTIGQLACLAMTLPLFAADPPAPVLPPPVALQPRLLQNPPPANPDFPKFDLDFPGGTPAQLVAAITKASAKPLNAVIPSDCESVELPPLKMKNVDVQQLFNALSTASMRTVMYVSGSSPFQGTYPQYQNYQTSFGFRAAPNSKYDQDTIWIFFHDKPNLPPKAEAKKACRFYAIGVYTDSYPIEAITTAIQTGWKMLGVTDPPALNYHKDTDLLIAVGDPALLTVIEDVLQNLKAKLSGKPGVPPPAVDPATGLPPASRPVPPAVPKPSVR